MAAAIKAASLPALPAEGNIEHYHAHLDVVVDGAVVAVPALIGIDLKNQQISPVHTHDTTGVIHIESPSSATYTLGQFFTEWGVRLDADCVGDRCTGSGRQMAVTVDGRPFTGDPATITLTRHAEIAIWSGPAGKRLAMPASYNFPTGL